MLERVQDDAVASDWALSEGLERYVNIKFKAQPLALVAGQTRYPRLDPPAHFMILGFEIGHRTRAMPVT